MLGSVLAVVALHCAWCKYTQVEKNAFQRLFNKFMTNSYVILIKEIFYSVLKPMIARPGLVAWILTLYFTAHDVRIWMVACSFSILLKRAVQGELMNTKSGTLHYFLAAVYDRFSDVWSLGIITYVMLCGWRYAPEKAKHLIRKLLCIMSSERLTAGLSRSHTMNNAALQVGSGDTRDGNGIGGV